MSDHEPATAYDTARSALRNGLLKAGVPATAIDSVLAYTAGYCHGVDQMARLEEANRIADALLAVIADLPTARAWCAAHQLGLEAGVGAVLSTIAHDIRTEAL